MECAVHVTHNAIEPIKSTNNHTHDTALHWICYDDVVNIRIVGA